MHSRKLKVSAERDAEGGSSSIQTSEATVVCLDQMTTAARRLGDKHSVVRSLGLSDAFADRGSESMEPSILLSSHSLLLGPFAPLDSSSVRLACPKCVERRWQAVRHPVLRDALEVGWGTQSCGSGFVHQPFLGTHVEQLTHYLETGESVLGEELHAYPGVLTVDVESLATKGEPLVPDPECPVCADPCTDVPEATRLTPRQNQTTDELREAALGSYALQERPLANATCGALGPKVLRDIASPTVAATVGCTATRSGPYLKEAFWGGHTSNYRDSTTVGLFEGLEREAGMRPRSKVTGIRSSYVGVMGQALNPKHCGLYAKDFYLSNSDVEEYSKDRAIDWVWGYSLSHERPILVPEILAYYHIPGQSKRFVQESSSGCASGASPEEAALHGLLELIERDAFLIAWYGGEALPELDPESFSDARTKHLIDRLELIGYRARFFDARSSINVPAVLAVAEREDGDVGSLCFGAGASLDPERAVAAALAEIATDAPNASERTLAQHQRLLQMYQNFDLVQQLHDHPLLHGLPQMRKYSQFLLGNRQSLETLEHAFGRRRGLELEVKKTTSENLSGLVSLLSRDGFEAIVVDQTTPEQTRLGVSCVGTIVPGLLPIDFGWSRQRALHMERLCSANYQAGLSATPLHPAGLNRVPHPFP